MARGKRRAPVEPAVVLPETTTRRNKNPMGDKNVIDEVDDFVAQRHKVMLEKIGGGSSDSDDVGNEHENHDVDVLNIDMSESDDDGSDGSDSDEGSGGDADGDEDKKGWGGKKRLWYGADTHEYEIMEDDERQEALKDEEEEALRMQREALSLMRPEDYRDMEDDETEAEDDAKDQEGEDRRDVAPVTKVSREVAGDVLDATAPEVPSLVKEMLECRAQVAVWRERVQWNELARIRFHLHASFVQNVAYYLSLRVDPDCERVDIRRHPVVAQIGRIRALLKKALSLPCEEPNGNLNVVRDAATKSLRPLSSTLRESRGADKSPESHDAKPQEQANLEVLNETGGNKSTSMTKRKKSKRTKRRREAVEDDEERLRALITDMDNGSGDGDVLEDHKDRKRRKLNQIVGAMERERKNKDGKRLASADVEPVRREPAVAKNVSRGVQQRDLESGEQDLDFGEMDDDDDVMQRMLAKKAKKEARQARKAASVKPHVYRFKDEIEPNSRRKASSQVVKNRGLTRYRPKDKKTPRTKNRLAYGKAVVRRKGAVRDYDGKPGGSYSGEASGINMNARKGSKLSNV